METRFSIPAAAAILNAHGFGDNSAIMILRHLKANEQIKPCDMQGAYVLQSNLNAAINWFEAL